jgi:hypothetical protein
VRGIIYAAKSQWGWKEVPGSLMMRRRNAAIFLKTFVAVIIGRRFSQIWLHTKSMKSIILKVNIYFWLPT